MSFSLVKKRAMSSLQQVSMNFCCAPIVLIDFDQTITLKDTIGVLGEFGIAKNNYSKPWSYFVDSYLEDYRGHQAHLPDLPTNSSFKDFVQQLDSYKPVEKASLARVSQHKVFGGLSRHDFVQKGKRLRETLLQPNVISTLKQYKENVRIVSLNWSKDWILGFVSELGLAREQIYSNDVVFVNGTCTGEITPSILTPGDKQSLIKREIINTNQRVIYIGDSLGDIEALVESDIGIIIGQDTSLLEPLAKYGFKVQDNVSEPSPLYRVNNWDQIKLILDQQLSSYTHTQPS